MTARPTIAAVQRVTAEEFGVPIAVMTADSRAHAAAHPRQAAIALSLELTGRGSVMVGRQFGDRDHTTVLHARKAVAARRAADPELDALLRRIEARLAAPPAPPPPEPVQLAFLTGPLFDLDDFFPDPAPPRQAGPVAVRKRAEPHLVRGGAAELAHLPRAAPRDPCFRCGARADIGCRHHKPATATRSHAYA